MIVVYDTTEYQFYLAMLLEETTRLADSTYISDPHGALVSVVNVATLTLETLERVGYGDEEFQTRAKKLTNNLKANKASRSDYVTPRRRTSSPSVSNSSVSLQQLAKTEKQAELPLSGAEKQKKERVVSDRTVITSDLIAVFCEVTGLSIPQSMSHAAINKLWRTPLWEIYQQLCDEDIVATKSAIASVCRHMRDSNLTFDSPNSIIRVARSMAAEKKIGSRESVAKDESGGFWL